MKVLRARLGDVYRQLLCTIHSRPASLRTHGPLVSFCFDDFPRSAYLIGGTILRSCGARGTYYAAAGLINSRNELGEQMTRDDIFSLLEDGHELGTHTFSHISGRRAGTRRFEDDVQRGREAIRELTGTDPENFAYPYGHVTTRLKKKIGAEMRSCRGIFGGINSQWADLNLLRANSLYGASDRTPEVKSLLEENQRQKGWLIFYTHDVSSTPSQFGCTPSLLEECVYLANERGASIVTIGQALDCIQYDKKCQNSREQL